jgi:outer membrane protein OmpA-like peptidoglycan-associated protein
MRSPVKGRTVGLVAALLLAALAGGGCANRMHDENVQLHHQNRELQAELDARRARGASDEESMVEAPPAPAPAPQPVATQPVVTQTPPPINVAGTETTEDPVAGTMTVRVPGDVLFDAGRATVREQAKATLDKVAAALKKDYSGKQIRVEGHTDSDPIKVSRWKNNGELSVARADAVKKYLVSKGVDAGMVSVQGFGSDKPKSNDKAQNRRVEIVVVTR